MENMTPRFKKSSQDGSEIIIMEDIEVAEPYAEPYNVEVAEPYILEVAKSSLVEAARKEAEAHRLGFSDVSPQGVTLLEEILKENPNEEVIEKHIQSIYLPFFYKRRALLHFIVMSDALQSEKIYVITRLINTAKQHDLEVKILDRYDEDKKSLLDLASEKNEKEVFYALQELGFEECDSNEAKRFNSEKSNESDTKNALPKSHTPTKQPKKHALSQDSFVLKRSAASQDLVSFNDAPPPPIATEDTSKKPNFFSFFKTPSAPQILVVSFAINPIIGILAFCLLAISILCCLIKIEIDRSNGKTALEDYSSLQRFMTGI